LIFDDPAELAKSQRPFMVRSGRGPFKPARPRRARAMDEFFFENLRNPAHNRRAGPMRQFSFGITGLKIHRLPDAHTRYWMWNTATVFSTMYSIKGIENWGQLASFLELTIS
jgi:hypothetical protein